MGKIASFMAAILMSALAAESSGYDFPTISRKLTREPKYTHNPQYFLLVFGPEAKTSVWCVLDGDKTLYVDRNGNGDLTEEGERFVLNEKENQFLVGDITEKDGKTTYRNLRVWPPTGTKKGSAGYFMIDVEIEGRYVMFTTIDINKGMARPQDAPVRHLGGPLSVAYPGKDQDKLVRGKSDLTLTIFIGTFNDASGDSGVSVEHAKGVPEGIHPVAQIAYPGKTPGAPRVIRKELLTHRC